jgi:hypothetical protein
VRFERWVRLDLLCPSKTLGHAACRIQHAERVDDAELDVLGIQRLEPRAIGLSNASEQRRIDGTCLDAAAGETRKHPGTQLRERAKCS